MKFLLATTALLLVSSAYAFVAPLVVVGNGRSETSFALQASRKPFISGNWKLNPQTKEEATKLAADIAAAVTKDSPAEVALFVPYVFIEAAQKATNGKVQVGAEVSFFVSSLMNHDVSMYKDASNQSFCPSLYFCFVIARASVRKSPEPLQELFRPRCCNLLVFNGLWLVTRNDAFFLASRMNTLTVSVLSSWN
jgi:Triosephosphate isomerase